MCNSCKGVRRSCYSCFFELLSDSSEPQTPVGRLVDRAYDRIGQRGGILRIAREDRRCVAVESGEALAARGPEEPAAVDEDRRRDSDRQPLSLAEISNLGSHSAEWIQQSVESLRRRIDEKDPYMVALSSQWSDALRAAYRSLPQPDWT